MGPVPSSTYRTKLKGASPHVRSTRERNTSLIEEVSNTLTRLHKEQFGRGPNSSRAYFAGPDLLVCVLRDVLLPAELKLVELGERARVSEARASYQLATNDDFTAAIEKILNRRVIAFASGVDPVHNAVFENFLLAPQEPASADFN